uniref:Uncharacterized protein n=1 Tax=Oryza barthii TaxID=65489 RepID=A0A0D3HK45_9ORYZ
MRSSVLATDPCAHQRRRQIRNLIVLQTIETKKSSGRRRSPAEGASTFHPWRWRKVDEGARGNLNEREERRGAAAAARHPRRFSFSYSIYISSAN